MPFHPLPKLGVFIFLAFESILFSQTSSLKPYCHQSPCFTLPFYFEDSFSRDTFLLTCLSYVYSFYYVGCLSNIGFFSVFYSVVLYFLMRQPTCVSVSMIVCLICLFTICGYFRRYEEIRDP